MQDLFRAFPALLREFEQSDEMREALVFAAWRRIAGDLLCDQTSPSELIGSRLVIAVTSKTWQRHLEDLSGQMIFKLNSVLGSAVVRYIEFQIDEKSVKADRASRRTVQHAEPDEKAIAALTAELEKPASVITDGELRQRFLDAAGSCLERKERIRRAGGQ